MPTHHFIFRITKPIGNQIFGLNLVPFQDVKKSRAKFPDHLVAAKCYLLNRCRMYRHTRSSNDKIDLSLASRMECVPLKLSHILFSKISHFGSVLKKV